MQARTKDLRFGRSPVHAWGLFARAAIPKEEFVIEYVGETIRSSLEDCKELEYQRSGLGSSYLFRVDKDTVVDATKKVFFVTSSLPAWLQGAGVISICSCCSSLESSPFCLKSHLG